jgi:hypothetical protein
VSVEREAEPEDPLGQEHEQRKNNRWVLREYDSRPMPDENPKGVAQ